MPRAVVRTAAEILRDTMPERDLQDAVLDLGHLYGWRTVHFRPAQTKHGWRTPVQGDGKGFLDTQLLRGPRLIVAECKRAGEKLTPEQQDWWAAWELIPCAELYLWMPKDIETIPEILR